MKAGLNALLTAVPSKWLADSRVELRLAEDIMNEYNNKMDVCKERRCSHCGDIA